jgi:hypothetical protein
VKNVQTKSLNLGRGVIGATVSAVAAVGGVALLWFLFLACKWVVTGATRLDREYDLRDAYERLPYPALGCAVLAACAGWEAYAPRASRPFAWTFAIVTMSSLSIWFVAKMFELTPRRYKSLEHPFLYPSEAALMIGAPFAVTVALTIFQLCWNVANEGHANVGEKSSGQAR